MKKYIIIVFFIAPVLAGFSQTTPVKDFTELPDPQPANLSLWNEVATGAHSGFVSEDERFDKSASPSPAQLLKTWNKKAWRGERVNTQAIIYTTIPLEGITLEVSDLENPFSKKITKDNVHAYFIRYVMTNHLGNLKSGCGITQKLDSSLAADMIDNISSFSMEANTSRPLWLSVDVPADAEPGIYKGTLKITGSQYTATHAFSIEVSDHILPDPRDWKFHLDLWQNPYSDARVNHVEPWSEAHFAAMRPNYEMLANAGQKVITTTLIEDPWKSQTYDVYGGMIKWIKQKDGNWKYDYTVFDKWVKFMMNLGIDKQINCYSMIPWSLKFTYFDEASNSKQALVAKPASKEYGEHWSRMLKDFARHLKEKGWFTITTIAMDERSEEDMQAAIKVIRSADANFKISMAGNYHPKIQAELMDYCVASNQHIPSMVMEQRKAKHFFTTFYTACPEPYPNTFTSNQYSDATWLSWFALNKNYDGYLRWAYNCWGKDPLTDSRFGSWPAGDTYFVYPGARSSIRFERLREGIQDYEKFKILQDQFKKSGKLNEMQKLESVLKDFEIEKLDGSNSNIAVEKAHTVLNSF